MEEIVKIKEMVDKTLEYVVKLDTDISMETWEKLDTFYRRIEKLEDFFRRVDKVNDWIGRYGELLNLDNVRKVAKGVKLLEPIMKEIYEEDD